MSASIYLVTDTIHSPFGVFEEGKMYNLRNYKVPKEIIRKWETQTPRPLITPVSSQEASHPK